MEWNGVKEKRKELKEEMGKDILKNAQGWKESQAQWPWTWHTTDSGGGDNKGEENCQRIKDKVLFFINPAS